MWLPKAHVEAPVFGSILLAAILLKMGTYGVFLLAIVFDKSRLSSLFLAFSIWGMAITSLYCTKIMDIKVIIALSSVSHMGLLLALIFLSSQLGGLAAILMMVTHGLTSSALFFNANQIYESSNSRNLLFRKGVLSSTTPSLVWSLIVLSNISAPPSINFFAELLGVFIFTLS